MAEHVAPPAAAYCAGDWVAVVGRDAWLLLDVRPDDPMVLRCWQVLAVPGPLDPVLDALAAGGIAAAPAFALARFDSSERRVVVRGTAEAAVVGPDGATAHRAAPGTSWTDVPVAADAVHLVLRGPDAASALALPLAAGVTPAGQIRVDLHPAPVEALALAPALEVPPVAAPVEVDAAAAIGVPAPPPEPVADPAPSPPAADEESAYLYLLAPTGRPPAPEVVAAAAAEPVPPRIDPPGHPEPAPAVHDEDDHANTAGWLSDTGIAAEVIDEVPGMAAPAAGLAEPPPPPPPPAAVPAPQAHPAPPTLDVPVTGPGAGALPAADHAGVPDGVEEFTVDRSRLTAAAAAGPIVLAALCPARHLTPVNAASCRVCGAPVPAQQGFESARPVLGALRLSTGDVVTLDRGVVFGRRPDAPAPQDGPMPNVFRLESPERDLSRNHAEFVLDGWNVFVRDLDSTNGTFVTLPGQQPVRLRPHDLFGIVPGTRIHLAAEVEIRFEVVG